MLKRSRQGDSHGFSLVELLTVIAIMGTIAAIAIPITLAQRAGGVEAGERADLLKVSTKIEKALTGWRGAPAAQVDIITWDGAWKALMIGDAASTASGALTPNTNVTGTVWVDGSYCLRATNPGGTPLVFRSDTDAITRNATCPGTALGGAAALAGPATTPASGLPTAVRNLALTPSNNQIVATWTAPATPGAGTITYTVTVNGMAPINVGAGVLTRTITGVQSGPKSVTVYAKNTLGAGPSKSKTTTVTGTNLNDTFISSLTGDHPWIDMPLLNGWTSYAEAKVSDSYSYPEYTKSRGIVALHGLIWPGDLTAYTVPVAYLPPGYRPDKDMIFGVLNNNIPRQIYVRANGAINLGYGFTTEYVSLDSIVFPAAGTATWTNVGDAGSGSDFANGWKAYGTTWGPPRFWKDPDGIVWLAGMVSTGTATDNTNIFTLPASHRAWREQHVRVTASGGYGAIGARPGDGVNVKVNTSNAWISLAGAIITTQDAQNNLNWITPPYVNGYTTRTGNIFPEMGYTQTSYGLVILQGLFNQAATSVGKSMFYLPSYMVPKRQLIQGVITGNNPAGARVDVKGWLLNAGTGGDVYLQATSTTPNWMSLDGIAFLP